MGQHVSQTHWLSVTSNIAMPTVPDVEPAEKGNQP
jgi:hypothetical protein